MFRRFTLCLLCGLGALTLAACSDQHHLPTDADVLAAEDLRPASHTLAAKYERSCLACHGVRSTAPLTGFEPHWAPRLAQGMPTLLKHTREGLRGMPAMGLCADCSDDELRALITFMSTPR